MARAMARPAGVEGRDVAVIDASVSVATRFVYIILNRTAAALPDVVILATWIIDAL